MGQHNVLTSVLAVMALLAVASVLSVAAKRLRLPFSISLVVVGLVLGELSRREPSMAFLGALTLSPEILIYIFLPTLVYEAAFRADSRLMLRNALPILVLGVPSLVLCFALTAFGMHWAVGLPIGAALLFGALISATDSTAVLAVFKDLGAPKRLNILAEGENLFNDATAVVLFQLVLGALGLAGGMAVAEGRGIIGPATVSFFANFVGGFGVGLAMGALIGKIIELIENDDFVEILLTTVLAYLSFLVAEELFQVSGIMAVVGAGMMLSGWGRTKFSPPTLHYLNRFWAYLAFVMNSLVFLMAGLVIPRVVDLSSFGSLVLPVSIAIVVAIGARALSIFGLFPIVNRLPGIEYADVRYQTAMAWGGLRGAMSLVLAMSIPEAFPYRDLILAFTVGVVLFSLLVQVLTLEPLINWLGLERATVVEQFVHEESVLAAKQRARQRLPELRKGGIFSDNVVGALEERYADEEDALRQRIEEIRAGGRLGLFEEIKILKRECLLIEKRAYLDLFQSGLIGEDVLKDLLHSVELQIDYLRFGGILPPWTLHSPLRWKLEAGLYGALDTLFPASRLAQRQRLLRIAERYETHWARLAASERVLGRLRVETTSGEAVIAEVRDLYVRWNDNSRTRLDAIAEQFPEYASKVQELMAARLCLQAEAEAILELETLEVLPEREARFARSELEARLRRLRRKPIKELEPRPEELLAKVPLFRGLPPDEFQRVVHLLRPRTYMPEEVILREGDVGDSLFLIGRGVVRVSIGGGGTEEVPLATLLAGDFFGEVALLTANPRNATVKAVTACTIYELRRTDLDAVREVCPNLQQVLETTYLRRRGLLTTPVAAGGDPLAG